MKLYGRRIGDFFEENANKCIRGFSQQSKHDKAGFDDILGLP